MRNRVWGGALMPLLFVFGGSAAAQVADTLSLSLEEAVALALSEGEEVGLAKARVDAAGSGLAAARAAFLPQVGTALTFTKTFASVFEGAPFSLPDSLRFEPDPSGTLDERVTYLEDMAPMAGLGGLGQMFGNLPFGRENAYLGVVTAEQVLYAGGRIRAGLAMAREGLEAAERQSEEERAALELEVTRAYYGVLLARAFETIADTALQQAEAFLAEERLRHDAGRTSELDVLRAE